jgi:4,5-DOPA dioxygenase extradiol
MAALFAGHGSPMNAIEENEFTRGLRDAARRIPRPQSILCISAHWQTRGVYVTGSGRPPTIHDFSGFPKELHEVQYPAPGDPELARRVSGLAGARIDPERGLDHGAWGVLRIMYPEADIPVIQLSLDAGLTRAGHYELAKKLGPLRDDGVLIVASGNIVHNLRAVDFTRNDGVEWAVRFNDEIKRLILAGAHDQLAAFDKPSPDVRMAVPTPEHFLPLLYTLAVKSDGERVSFFNDQIVMGSISMTSVLIGG